MDLRDRICRYMAAVPPAIQGQDGSGQTFFVACQLVNGFGLTRDDAIYLMNEYNKRCQPPWSEKELEHKVDDAINKADHRKPKGHLINGNGKFNAEDLKENRVIRQPVKPQIKPKPQLDPPTAIEVYLRGRRYTEADIAQLSPIRPSDNFRDDAALLVEALYKPGELINFVTTHKMFTQKDGTEKANPIGYGETVERNALLDRWSFDPIPDSPCGGWMRMNPMDGKGVADKNVTSHRFILIEFDSIPLDLQISLLSMLPLPIACILTSGSRSIHAWVKADCLDATNYKDTVTLLLAHLSKFGLDEKNKNPSRLSRLVGVQRVIGAKDGGKQRLIYLNPNPTGIRIAP